MTDRDDLEKELETTRGLLRDSAQRSAALETALADLIRVCESRPETDCLMSFEERVLDALPAAQAVYRGVTPESEKRS